MSAAGAKVGSAASVVLSRASKALARVVASNGSSDDKTREKERKTEEVKRENTKQKNTVPSEEKHFLTGRTRKTTGPGKTEPLLRKGENPSARPTPRQSEIDDMLRLRKSGQTVEPEISFLNGRRCKRGTPGSIRVDNWVNDHVAHEMKNYNLRSNSNRLVNEVVEQALKHHKHLPDGTRQIFKIDARGQVCTPKMERNIVNQILKKSENILKDTDIQIIRE